MEQLGIDFNATGSVMTSSELVELRRKRGECTNCGRKCFQKRLFKMIPITDHGRVLNGRCLNCKPLDATESGEGLIPAVSRPATKEDLARFSRSQSNLGISGPGVRSPGQRSQSGRSFSGSAGSSRNVTAAQSSSSSGRVPSRSTSGGLGAATAVARPDSDLDSSSQRGAEATAAISSRDRSITPVNSARRLEPSGTPSSSRRRRDTASQEQQQQHDGGDSYEQNDYTAGRRAVNDELNHEIAEMSGGGGVEAHPSSSRGVPRHHSGDNSHLGPRHGTLDRGGEISFNSNSQRSGASHATNSSHANNNNIPGSSRQQGSNRTLSSMGSVGEDMGDMANGRGNQMRYAANHYDEGGGQIDVGGSHHAALSEADERAIDRLHEVNGDCAEILEVMRECLDSPHVESFALKELSCLHLGPDDQDRLADLGAMDVISEAMHSYADDIELQIHGCRAIWNASGTPENQMAFVDAGALEIILSDMDRFIDNAEVQECALGTLSNLAAAEANLLRMVEKGTVGRVVESMNKHSENSLVQSKGCSAITNMASHLSPLKKDIMDMGGGGAVVICMVMHPDDFELQEKALRALKNLSSNNDENKVELANIGGIDAVITAMQVHRDQPGVQEAGAWTLSNLASNNDNKAVIGDCGGIDVVIRAMWVHSDVVKVQEWCCRALYTLTLDRHNSGMVLQVGGISAVVNAMQAHVDSGPVQEMGCAVLCNLAFDESSKMRIVDEEALDAIVLAMVLYTDNGKVQESACEVLLALAIVENFKSMQASNIGELARSAATKFPDTCKEPAHKLLHVLEGYCEQY